MRYLALVIPSMRYAISQGYNKGATGSALHLSRRDALHPICPAARRASRSLQRHDLARKVRQVLFRNDLATTRYSEGSLHETCRDRPFARLNYRLNVISPTLQCLAHRVGVARSIINSCNPALVAADVIKDCLDDVRLNAKLGHAGGASAAQIVQMPICNVQALV